ncbi:CBS domain-containing protein [Natronobeatus ordinarius]|uniref:CBS domain-containing protein n=1 Tax=Natronobeatus ordinarius TaxID=2963433 RepID=UPI0020CBE296|nr:CBS domain-containing protein [Natronobeatus ordinarius]
MEDIFVGRLMSTDLHTASPDTLVEDAAQVLLENDVGSVLVVDDEGGLEGILTRTDFVEIVAKSQPKAQTTVSRYMTEDVITTDAGASIRDVADVMMEHGFHHVPVVDEDDRVVGMLTTTDLAAYLSHVQTPSPGGDA